MNKVRFIGGPWDGKVRRVSGSTVKVAHEPGPVEIGISEPSVVDIRYEETVYNVHEFKVLDGYVFLAVPDYMSLYHAIHDLVYGGPYE